MGGKIENIGMRPGFVECDGLFRQCFNRQKVFDTAICAPFLGLGEMVFQQNALLANLTEIEHRIKHGKQFL